MTKDYQLFIGNKDVPPMRIANDTRYGLTSGVWTTNVSRAMRMVRAIEAGTVWVNTYRAGQVMAPFGGYKDSGFGKERGTVSLDVPAHQERDDRLFQ